MFRLGFLSEKVTGELPCPQEKGHHSKGKALIQGAHTWMRPVIKDQRDLNCEK